jgi:hypothetical protein
VGGRSGRCIRGQRFLRGAGRNRCSVCKEIAGFTRWSATAWRCLTLRSSGESPAQRLAHEAPWLIMRLAGQAPCRCLPLNSNVRHHAELPWHIVPPLKNAALWSCQGVLLRASSCLASMRAAAPGGLSRWRSERGLVRSASRGTTSVLKILLESQFVASAAGQGRAFVQGRRLRRREHQALASWGSRARLREEGPNSDA